jgi:hypothetical protein
MKIDEATYKNKNGQVITVYGAAQNTTHKPGDLHEARILKKVQDLVYNAPEGSYIVLDRSWWTATGRIGTFTLRRPDIIYVEAISTKKVKISAFEIPSPGQTDDELEAKLEEGFATIAGDSRILQGDLQPLR